MLADDQWTSLTSELIKIMMVIIVTSSYVNLIVCDISASLVALLLTDLTDIFRKFVDILWQRRQITLQFFLIFYFIYTWCTTTIVVAESLRVTSTTLSFQKVYDRKMQKKDLQNCHELHNIIRILPLNGPGPAVTESRMPRKARIAPT